MGSFLENLRTFDVKNAIVSSVVEVFDMMLSMKVKIDGNTSPVDFPGRLLLGSINLIGEVSGIVNIQVSDDFSRIMAGSLLDMAPGEIEGFEDIKDVLGELCNMVAGNLKSGLCDAGMECELSTPALIMGCDYNHEARHMEMYEYFKFACEGNLIAVDVGLKAANGCPADEPGEKNKQKDVIKIDIFNYDMEKSIANCVPYVFDTMLSINVEKHPKPANALQWEDRIISSISFSGKVMGRVNLHFNKSFSLQTTSSLLGIPENEIEGIDEIKDAVGEICNMISGAIKSDLCDLGLDCRVSPPSFTSGSDFEMECLDVIRNERFMFRHENDIIMVEVGLKPGNQ